MASSLSLSQSFSNFSSLPHQTSSPLSPCNPKPLHLRT
jgi:ribose 5-phosphate isomerase A